MPEADFSEFTYGNAVLREVETLLVRAGAALTRAPDLPSLLRENTVGYDAHLVTVDFAVPLQFKRAYFVSRQHPRGMCGFVNGGPHCTWAAWGATHYRFPVETESNQFNAMRGYEEEIGLGYRTGISIYVAPAFHREDALSRHYLRSEVLETSVGVLPSTFDAADGGLHHYSYDPAITAALVTSEPITVPSSTASSALMAAVDDNSTSQREGERLTLDQLGSWAASTAEALEYPLRPDMRSASGVLRTLGDFAALFGGAFVLIGHRQR